MGRIFTRGFIIFPLFDQKGRRSEFWERRAEVVARPVVFLRIVPANRGIYLRQRMF